DDLHLAGRGFLSLEHDDGLTRRLARVPFRAVSFEVAEAGATATSARPLLALAVLLGDDAHAETHERLRVVGHRPVARDDEDLADLLGQARLDLDDPRVVRVGGRRGALEELALLEAGRVDGDHV